MRTSGNMQDMQACGTLRYVMCHYPGQRHRTTEVPEALTDPVGRKRSSST